ncbi:hypothetical protein C0Z01_15855 [Photobacterium kishitanii]|uniref:hypothetical protein n=1 Tax=Photobacterium kishitanii TaxID=318456 RepID=UPI0007EF6E61|nr:hypothetical protein [Photobacterium kishitanii]OBU27957.1 hypothetical protein AYY22_14865 [Photobacterium kishitanii]PSU19220.1 hypothetical protein CTM84_17325 [Photobacterium kishitanii]PSV15773.1 hypothetical protein C0W59_09235 [Photobacterium kishitanii]PSW49424.1 hypothetical protein C0W66_09915 [Photobacterium kishitanii]PSW62805.1 hypothetical protein C0W54_04640 [Photobacterium kishitanii]
MNKLALTALITTTLLGCNSNDGEDIIVDKVGLDISALTNEQKQNYAQISTDINTLIINIAGKCFDAAEATNPNVSNFSCNIAEYIATANKTEYSTITLIEGTLDVSKKSTNTFKIETDNAVKFRAPIISTDIIAYSLRDNNEINFVDNDPLAPTVTFRGFYIDERDNNASYWTAETLEAHPLKYNEDNNNQYISLYDGQAKLTGKDEQTYSWSTNSAGKVILQ